MANKFSLRSFLRSFVLVLLTVSLAACSTGQTRERIERDGEQANQGVERAKTPAGPITYNPLVVTDEAWGGNRSLRLRNGLPLPGRFENPRSVTLVSADPMSLTDINNTVSSQTSIPMRFGAGADSAVAGKRMQINYVGSLSGLLSQISNFYELNWRYDGVAITFTRFETRVFVVEALPGKVRYADEVDSADTAAGSSTSSSSSNSNALNQEARLESDLDFWKEMTESVNALLGGVGRSVVSQSTGTITVTTTTEVMKNVARFIEQQNDIISKQVAVNVQVFTVDLTNNDEFQVNLDTVFNRFAPFTTGLGGASGAPFTLTGAGNFAISIVDSSLFGRVDYVMNSLAAVGNASRVAEFPMTTINNRPVSRRVGVDRAYLAQVSQTVNDSVTTTSLTPGTVREGFSLQLTPRMMMDGRMLLQYSLSLQELLQLRSFESGGNSIQLPETSSKVFVQQSLLRSGQTLILAGFSDDRTNQRSQGQLNPFNYLFGGGAVNSSARQILFIAITPQEIEIPRTE